MLQFVSTKALVALFAVISFAAHANASFYECRMMLITNTADPVEQSFKTKLSNEGSHGGTAKEFNLGNNVITVSADSKWMTINWMRGEQTVAAGIFAEQNPVLGSRAFILYNPADFSEQVSLTCDPE